MRTIYITAIKLQFFTRIEIGMNGPPRSIYSNSDNYNNSITIPGTRYRRKSRNQSSRNSLSSIRSENRQSIEGNIVPHIIYGWNEERGEFVNELNNNAVISNMILNLRTPKAVTRRNSRNSSHGTEKVQYRKRKVKKTRKRAVAKSTVKHTAKHTVKHSRKQKRLQKHVRENTTK